MLLELSGRCREILVSWVLAKFGCKDHTIIPWDYKPRQAHVPEQIGHFGMGYSRLERETALRVFAHVSRKVVDEQIPAAGVRDAIFAEIPREQVELALVAYHQLSDTRLDSPLAFLLRRYSAATHT